MCLGRSKSYLSHCLSDWKETTKNDEHYFNLLKNGHVWVDAQDEASKNSSEERCSVDLAQFYSFDTQSVDSLISEDGLVLDLTHKDGHVWVDAHDKAPENSSEERCSVALTQRSSFDTQAVDTLVLEAELALDLNLKEFDDISDHAIRPNLATDRLASTSYENNCLNFKCKKPPKRDQMSPGRRNLDRSNVLSHGQETTKNDEHFCDLPKEGHVWVDAQDEGSKNSSEELCSVALTQCHSFDTQAFDTLILEAESVLDLALNEFHDAFNQATCPKLAMNGPVSTYYETNRKNPEKSETISTYSEFEIRRLEARFETEDHDKHNIQTCQHKCNRKAILSTRQKFAVARFLSVVLGSGVTAAIDISFSAHMHPAYREGSPTILGNG